MSTQISDSNLSRRLKGARGIMDGSTRARFLKVLCLYGVSALPIFFASGASAQTADPAASSQSSAEATADNEIIVTATRRPERLQDVPLSVSVFQTDQLSNAQARDNRDLALLTPGLRMEATNNFTAPTIRGVSTTLVGANADPNVATYIDGIYQQFPQSAIFVLPDVKQIEVLKGPQGTLFGRNATGGAILITTRDPHLGQMEGAFEGSYASYNDVMGKGYLSVPLSEGLAASVAVFGQHREGWYHLQNYGGRHGGGVDSYLIRGKLRYAPNPDVDFTLTGLISRQDDYTQGLNESLFGNNSNLSRAGAVTASTPYIYAGDLIPSTDTRTTAFSLRGKIKAGPGYFTTTTAYQKNKAPVVFDNDNTNLPLVANYQLAQSRTISQELLYTLDDAGPLHGTVGAYFYWNRATHFVNVNPGADGIRGIDGALVRDVRESAAAQSVFGELTYDVSPQFSVTGGLRYSSETREGEGTQWSRSVVNNSLPLQKKTFTSLTPRVSLVFKADENHNLYATFSQGFKSGTFNVLAMQRQPVSPEKLTSYEIGSKNRFGNFTLDLAGFYYDYTNLQVQSLITDPNTGSFISIVNNAATSEIYGAEANLSWRPNRDFHLSAGAAWTHGRYKRFQNASVVAPLDAANPTGTPSCDLNSYTHQLSGGYKSLFCDASGNQMLRTPELTANLAADYTLETSAGKFSASAVVYWTDTIYYDPNNFVKQDPYATINAQLGYQPSGNDRLKISVFATNLTNNRVFESVFESSSVIFVRYAPPRQIGGRISYSF